MVGTMTGQIGGNGRSHERQRWGMSGHRKSNKGRHHKLVKGQIVGLLIYDDLVGFNDGRLMRGMGTRHVICLIEGVCPH